MKINRRIAIRVSLLVTLAVALSVASSRHHADTGNCGGTSITLPFVDVLSSNIFFCSIAEAYFSGLTNGTDGTHYSPSANVTREQMAAFITRTQDSALKRGSHRAALNQWAIPTSVPFTGKTVVGDDPQFVSSDGEDLWVANNGSGGTVSRVHASDGRLLGTWTGAVFANGVVIARGRVFVTGNTSPGAIYVIDPSQPPGAVTTLTSALPANPYTIAFDGFYLWTANEGAGSISKVNSNTGVATNFTGFNGPAGIIYDGTNIWVTENGTDVLVKIDKTTGLVLLTVTVGSAPAIPIFDGANIWVPHSSNSVTVVKASTGVVLATLTGNGLSGPFQAAFDGERILVTNPANSSVSLWNASDLTPLGFAMGGTNVSGACSDGLNFWLTLEDGPPGHLVRF